LHTVFDPYLLAGQLPTDDHLGLEDDVVFSQAIDKPRVASEVVVMVAGK